MSGFVEIPERQSSSIESVAADINQLMKNTSFLKTYDGNALINGNFSVWQRGTYFDSAGFTADRWYHSVCNGEIIQRGEFPIGSAYSENFSKYYCNISINQATQPTSFSQKIEDVRSFQGKTITVSFWTNSNVNFSSCYVDFIQHFGSGGSALVDGPNNNIIIDDTFSRKEITLSIPSIEGKIIGENSYLQIRVVYTPQTTGYLNIADVQVNEGDSAHPFFKRHASLELLMCMRYFYQISCDSSLYIMVGEGGLFNDVDEIIITGKFPVRMRKRPIMTYSALSDFDIEPFDEAPVSIVMNFGNQDQYCLHVNTQSSFTRGFAGGMFIQVAGGYMRFDAEF